MLLTLTEMQRWGHIGRTADLGAIAAQVVAADTHRAAAAELGLPAPTIDYKSEGLHATAWTLQQATGPVAMGSDRLLGGRIFDPPALDARRVQRGEESVPAQRATLPAPKEKP